MKTLSRSQAGVFHQPMPWALLLLACFCLVGAGTVCGATVGVRASPPTSGTVSGGGVFPTGSNILISATAFSPGWKFMAWNDGNTNATRTITVPAAGVTNTAIFALVETLSFRVLAGLAANPGSADGANSAARFNLPAGVGMDNVSNVLYVADSGNHTIRKVTPTGLVTTLAGSAGLAGTNDNTGNAARFNHPAGVAVANVYGSNSLYVADQNNHTIRMVTLVGSVGTGGVVTAAGVVTTLAGNPGWVGSIDGTGSVARFNSPAGVAVNHEGTVYVADSGNHTIRTVTPDGVVTTLAGSPGLYGSTDGATNLARFYYPTGLAVDGAGNVYVADRNNHTIRKVTSAGVVTTIAGSAGWAGSADGVSTNARFNAPAGLALDSLGNLYVADSGNHTLRKVTPAGMVTTIAGSAGIPGSSDGVSSAFQFNQPLGVAVNGDGILLVADTSNQRLAINVLVAQIVPIAVQAAPPSAATVTGPGLYPVGTNIQISASAVPGWGFTGWNDGATTNTVRMITVPLGGAIYTASYVSLPPAISVTPAGQFFGDVLVGGTRYRVLTVKNIGGGVLTGSATCATPLSILSGGAYTLGAGASQAVMVLYSPTAVGKLKANVIFTGGGGVTNAMVGAGVAPTKNLPWLMMLLGD